MVMFSSLAFRILYFVEIGTAILIPFKPLGDMKLIICDIERKVMRVYKGTSLLIETQLLDTPVAICVSYADTSLPRIASVVV